MGYDSVSITKSAKEAELNVVMRSIDKLQIIDKVVNDVHNNIETTARNVATNIRLGKQLLC